MAQDRPLSRAIWQVLRNQKTSHQGRHRVHGVAVLTSDMLTQAIWEMRTPTSIKTSKFSEVAHALAWGCLGRDLGNRSTSLVAQHHFTDEKTKA